MTAVIYVRVIATFVTHQRITVSAMFAANIANALFGGMDGLHVTPDAMLVGENFGAYVAHDFLIVVGMVQLYMMLKALVCGECISAIRRGALEGPLVGVTTIEMRFQVRDAFSAMRAVLSRDLPSLCIQLLVGVLVETGVRHVGKDGLAKVAFELRYVTVGFEVDCHSMGL